MFGFWLFSLLLQTYFCFTAQAATLPLPYPHVPIALTETGNISIANHASVSVSSPGNELSLFFATLGDPIPAAELRHALLVANARVQGHLPQYADHPIDESLFETNVSFPKTGDGIYIYFYAYGFGLSWGQLSHALVMLRAYITGQGPGNPHAHYQQLDFYVSITAGLDVARGAVEFTPGARAVAKRNLATSTLQLLHANLSLPSAPPTLPIIFPIRNANLDLKITTLGLPIPPSIVLKTIEAAFTDVILKHTDIDSPIPANRPYSFNHTTGRYPHLSNTEIRINTYPRKQISWGLLCIVFYGLRDFMRETEHFNGIHFIIVDGRHGILGHGYVHYSPAPETASTERLKLE